MTRGPSDPAGGVPLRRCAFAAIVMGVVLPWSPVRAADAAAAPEAVPAHKFYVEDIKAAMAAHIKARADADGVFTMKDDRTGELLKLRFVTIHDPVRQIDGNTYFACTDFHVVGNDKKLYDLDFWMNPVSGELAVYDEKVHKEPRRSWLYGWYKQPRYTFVNDRIVSLY